MTLSLLAYFKKGFHITGDVLTIPPPLLPNSVL